MEHNLKKHFFFINFYFDFGFLVQKCLKPFVNGVLKFQFFFLNLSSKIPAGVRVRLSKYPYVDICVLESGLPDDSAQRELVPEKPLQGGVADNSGGQGDAED